MLQVEGFSPASPALYSAWQPAWSARLSLPILILKKWKQSFLVVGLSHLLYGVTLSELRAKYWCDGCLGQVSDLPELANFLRDFLHLKNSQLVDSQLADQQVVVLSPAVLYLYLYLLHFCLCGGFYTCFSAASHISIAYPPQALQPVNFNSQT